MRGGKRKRGEDNCMHVISNGLKEEENIHFG